MLKPTGPEKTMIFNFVKVSQKNHTASTPGSDHVLSFTSVLSAVI